MYLLNRSSKRGELRSSPLACRLFMLVGLFPLPCQATPAVNQFEIKDLEIEVGVWEFQSQNAHTWGQPKRRFIEESPGAFEYDDNSVVQQRHALEIEVGSFAWMRNRIGIEFEKERLEEPATFSERNGFDSLKLEEIAAEAVIVFVDEERFGIGLLIEYQHVLEAEEADSIVFGPILAHSWGRWDIVLNPAFVQFFGGEDNDDKLDFTYGAHILYTVSPALTLGLESYGTIDRLGATGDGGETAMRFGDHDLHRLGPIAYYRKIFHGEEDEHTLTLGLGLFFGLNQYTPDATFKWSIEYEF